METRDQELSFGTKIYGILFITNEDISSYKTKKKRKVLWPRLYYLKVSLDRDLGLICQRYARKIGNNLKCKNTQIRDFPRIHLCLKIAATKRAITFMFF